MFLTMNAGDMKKGCIDFMFLWCVYLVNQEWCAYVIAPSRGIAKSIFWRCTPDICEYTDIRAYKKKPADGYEQGYYDMDCPVLESLGVRYMTEEEYYEWLESFQ